MAALAIVEVQALLEVVAAALVAGVGLTLLFSLVIYCATRAAELRRAGAGVGAWALGTLATAGTLACLAGVAAGILVMMEK